MRRLMLPLILFVAAACQPAAAPLSDADVAAVRALGTSYAQAYLAKDPAAAAALFAEDGVEMPPNRPSNVGRDAIRAGWAAGFDAGVEASVFTLTSAAIDGEGGLAYDRGAYVWTGTAPGLPEPMTDSGTYVSIARRQEDGSWLYAAVIWHSDLPLPQPE
jgi:uncharacterized protein (TIGR02246 family)